MSESELARLRAYTRIGQLEAENERLRAELESERTINLANGCPDCGVHHGCNQVVVERDRLRTVVARFQRTHAELDHSAEQEFSAVPSFRAFRAALTELLALDVSGDMGGTSGENPSGRITEKGTLDDDTKRGQGDPSAD